MKMVRIDCDECVMDGTTTCDDCVVTFILNRQPGQAIEFDAEENRALHLLQSQGMVPELRHWPKRAS
jgi:hypothetical protein